MAENKQFWHMQMHPNNKGFFDKYGRLIIEHYKFIGLGHWEEHRSQIDQFMHRMQIGDIVAIKNGEEPVVLVEVTGHCYIVPEDDSKLGWLVYRRPIRILDWNSDKRWKIIPRGTLNICLDCDAKTSKDIMEWYGYAQKHLQELGVKI